MLGGTTEQNDYYNIFFFFVTEVNRVQHCKSASEVNRVQLLC